MEQTRGNPYNKGMLSKSQYMAYLHCPKAFWLFRKRPELISEPSAHQQSIMQTGHTVGARARDLFPGGSEIPFLPENPGEMARRTRYLIESGCTTIYEAAFIHEGMFAAADILHWDEGSWKLYEVKSSMSLKDSYVLDMALQSWVIEKNGVSLKSVNLINLNRGYTREEELDLGELFKITDLSLRIRPHLIPIEENIERMKVLLENTEPEREIGMHCLSPSECPCHDYCWRTLAGVPVESVFTLTTTRMDEKFELFNKGYVSLMDLPKEGLGKAQLLQVEGKLHIEEENIRNFLAKIETPVIHLDFESFQQALPEYPGIKPFQQIPFQYSLHIEEGDRLVHKEFLADRESDPRRVLAERLIEDIPEEGTILAYNKTFEKSVINRLAARFPDLQPKLTSLSERLYDLMEPFQKRWYYHPEMEGSYSIKKVLPALVPEMEQAYGDLPGVHNGGEASSVWQNLPSVTDPAEVEEIRRGLLEYCRLDTLAMVRILDILRKV